GKAYALTRLSDDAGRTGNAPEVDTADAGVLRVDLGGTPLVLLAGRLADALAAEAVNGRSRLTAIDTNAGWAAPYLAFCVARHGLACQGSWRARAPHHPDEAAALIFSATPGTGGAAPTVALAEVGDTRLPDGLSITCTEEPVGMIDKQAMAIDFEAAI